MRVIRKRHAFDGQALSVISSIKRRGVLYVLAILPNGSRSLIPAGWTDWRIGVGTSQCDDDIEDASSLGRLGDLLQLRKILDALRSRQSESAPHVERSHAAESSVSRLSRSAEPPSTRFGTDRLGSTRRGRPDRRARDAGNSHRTHAGRRSDGVDGQ